MTPETLTEEERATINRYALDGRGQDLLMAKLLRIHDAQAARVKELEESHGALVKRCAETLAEEYRDQSVGYTEPWDATLEQVLSKETPEVAALARKLIAALPPPVDAPRPHR